MSDSNKNKVVTIIFLVFLYGIFAINVFKTPTDISTSERRKLARFPSVTVENVANTKFMSEFATFATDQFIGRDTFRTIKAKFLFDVLNQKDNNGIYIEQGHASKLLTDFKEGEVTNTVKNISSLYKRQLSKMNVYCAIIPDKNYFLAEENGYPHMDYERFEQVVKQNLNNKIQYINLFDTLSIDDYYTTDIHWKQEKLQEVTQTLVTAMNKKNQASNISMSEWQENDKYPFYGTYYGQSALPLPAETLKYITNKSINNVIVKLLDEKALVDGKVEWLESEMYDLAAFNGIDPYDIYLSGPKALITLENPKANTNKELIIFRDSFGSSLAPLLTSEYAKITLGDLRYISASLVKNIVQFKEGQDVLFIYSTEVLNNGSILKFM